MKSIVFNILLILLVPFLSIGQCLISDLVVTPSECNPSGDFFVEITFNHTETTNQFKVLGNGNNYGTFSYDDLPISVGPLDANCTTQYEFVIRDAVKETCTAFVDLGTMCCEDQCNIAFDDVVVGDCNGSLYSLQFNLIHEATINNSFDVYTNGSFFGFYHYEDLPLTIENFPSSTTETFNTVVVCANDNPHCCDTISLINPCICSIYNIRGQVVDCNEDTETFSMKLTFKHSLTADSFQIGGNSVNYGKFAYSDLPITIADLPFSPTTEYEFLIVDGDDAFCFGSYDLGVVTACNFECHIYDAFVEPYQCEDGYFYVDLSFLYENTSFSGFNVRGSGINYGNFEYGEPFYTLGPLLGDCTTKYEFVIRDLENESCKATTFLAEPICCEQECNISDLHITEYCENNDLVAFDVDFVTTRIVGNFNLIINNVNIGTYSYTNLPIKITNTNIALPNVVIKIIDSELESCHLIREYKFECYEEPVCNIYNMTVKPSMCNGDNKFFGILQFSIDHPGQHGFIIKINGQIIDTLEYGKDAYEIGPLAGDCETIYHFLIQDVSSPDCAEDFTLLEPVCCEEDCSIGSPSISYSICQEGTFDLTLQFEHTGTSNKFRLKVNGVVSGPYEYSSLPLVIENLMQNTVYEISVWDLERETCTINFIVPAIECPTSTNDTNANGVTVFNDNDHVTITLTQNWKAASATLLNVNGQTLSNQKINTQGQIDISALPIGLYIIHLQDEAKQVSKKILKY